MMITKETFEDVAKFVAEILKVDKHATRETLVELIEDFGEDESEIGWADVAIEY